MVVVMVMIIEDRHYCKGRYSLPILSLNVGVVLAGVHLRHRQRLTYCFLYVLHVVPLSRKTKCAALLQKTHQNIDY